MYRRLLLLLAAVVLLSSVSTSCWAVGKYCLAYWRETGFNEKGGIGGMHVCNVHVWDQYGNPLSNKQVYVGSTLIGTTDSNGQVEIALYEPNSYPFTIKDGSNLSDTAPAISTTRPPDWGHYCFEVGFMYFSDSASAANFDTNYDGILNSSSSSYACNNPEMSAPCMRSMAFFSTKPDAGYYCSDGWVAGNSVTSCGQTFKANGNRVVAAKFNAIGGNAQYTLRIREGGPTGAYVGSAATSPYVGTYEYFKTLTKWGINSVQVVPGNTYYLEITKSGGGSFAVNRVTNNNYPYGNYYEGTTAYSTNELRGHVICATVGGVSAGNIVGNVKSSTGANLSGATVSTNTGGYSATTDASGNYTLASVAPATYSVTASKAGYTTVTNTGVTVLSSQIVTSNFTLSSNAGTLAGNVKDSSGNNLSGATVSTNTGGYITTTNASGNYTLSGVAAGTYNVTASKSGFVASTQSGKTVTANNTTTVNFTLAVAPVQVELLTNGNFGNSCTGWSHSESPSNIYWGCGNKVYSGGSGSGGHTWNAFLSCGGTFCDRAFVGSQYQDNVTVTAGSAYTASAQVYYEPVGHPGDPSDQKERIVLTFNDPLSTVQASPWQTHTVSNGWNKITFTGTVPTGATKMQFKVELSHTDSQWSGTGGVDECSFLSSPPCTAPSISSHPAGATKNVGQSVTISVTASGSATLGYQWKKNGNNISGATSSTHTISSVSTADAGSYTCTVTNSCGNATSNAAVLVVATPVSTINAAKALGDGTVVSIANKAVTASTGSAFWIEESDRSSGIKAVASNSLAVGANVTVTGTLATANAERFLNSASFTTNGTLPVPAPYGLGNVALGGKPLSGCSGPGNVGLLVRVWGKVTKAYSDRFFINDGIMRSDFSGEIGLKVASGALTEPVLDKYVIVTGVVTTENTGGKNVPVLIPRTQTDIRVF